MAVLDTLKSSISLFKQRDAVFHRHVDIGVALELYLVVVDEIATAAVENLDPGLEMICRRMIRQLHDQQKQGLVLHDNDHLLLLEQSAILLESYLAGPNNHMVLHAMVHQLRDTRWYNPLSDVETESMSEDLLRWQEYGEFTVLSDGSDCPPSGNSRREGASPEQEAELSLDGEHKNYVDRAEPLLSRITEEINTIFSLAEQMELLGLQEYCLRVQDNIDKLRVDAVYDETVLDMLECFPESAYDYLAAPDRNNNAAAMIEYLRDARWKVPLRDDEVDGMMFLLLDGNKEPLPTEESSTHAEKPPGTLQENPSHCYVQREESFVDEFQPVDRELIALLMQELTGMQPELAALLDQAIEEERPEEEKRKSLINYTALIARIGLASQAIGMLALHEYLAALHFRITTAATAGFSIVQYERLSLLSGSILAYLAAPDDQSTCAGLIDLLQGEAWLGPPENSYVNSLLRGLSMIQLTDSGSDMEPRQTLAQSEDVDLTLPADLNQDLLDGLLLEIPIHCSEFSAAIQRFSAGTGTQHDMEIAKRAAHTLKGAANTVGVNGIANFTHHIEDILVALSRHGALPNKALSEVLSNAGDCLEAMGEAVMGIGPEPEYAVAVLQSVLDCANRIDREGIHPDDIMDKPSMPRGKREENQTGEIVSHGTSSEVRNEAMIRVPASLIDELLRLMGETIISNGQVRERLRRVIQQNTNIRSQNLVFMQLAHDLEELVDLRSANSKKGAGHDDFDPLEFEQYSELDTVSRRLIEAATDAGELARDGEGELDELKELVEVQARLHTQSQNTVLRTRMLSVGTVTSRLQRSVRQAARLLDKQVTLDIIGVDTMIDSNILNELVDPLMHMLRNAVDHGIEFPEQRAVLGKPAEGHIELTFMREGNQVVVRCRDDGAGLDLVSIRKTAEQRGLVTPEQTLSDDELSRLILAPGFSTKIESSQVSGRGIGMDVVHSRVLQLKGGLSLDAIPGKGLKIDIRLPATLISTYALLVRAQQHLFAISNYGIHDIHYVTMDDVHRSGAESYFRLGDELYPLTDFCTMLNLPNCRRTDERNTGFPLLLVRQDNGALHAVRLQEIVDSRELVVKSLGRYIPKIQGIVGATILGDGSVAAVIDLPEVMRSPRHVVLNCVLDDSLQAEHGSRKSSLLSALVVDDSLSARRATAQFMKDAGFEVRTAIDGLEAVSILEKWKPDILLVDMEMPRMNGLELTAHVRARDRLGELPVIMITSRSTEKHRRQAETAGVNVYLTKPFGDTELLKHVMELTAA